VRGRFLPSPQPRGERPTPPPRNRPLTPRSPRASLAGRGARRPLRRDRQPPRVQHPQVLPQLPGEPPPQPPRLVPPRSVDTEASPSWETRNTRSMTPLWERIPESNRPGTVPAPAAPPGLERTRGPSRPPRAKTEATPPPRALDVRSATGRRATTLSSPPPTSTGTCATSWSAGRRCASTRVSATSGVSRCAASTRAPRAVAALP